MVKCLHFILLYYVGIGLRGALVLILSLRPKFKAFTVTVGCLDIYYDTKYSLTVFYFRVNWTALTWWDVNLTSDLRGVRDSSRRSPRALLIARCDQLFLEVLDNKVGTQFVTLSRERSDHVTASELKHVYKIKSPRWKLLLWYVNDRSVRSETSTSLKYYFFCGWSRRHKLWSAIRSLRELLSN